MCVIIVLSSRRARQRSCSPRRMDRSSTATITSRRATSRPSSSSSPTRSAARRSRSALRRSTSSSSRTCSSSSGTRSRPAAARGRRSITSGSRCRTCGRRSIASRPAGIRSSRGRRCATQQVIDDIAPVNATTSIAFVMGPDDVKVELLENTAADDTDRAASRPLLRSAEHRDARVVREGLRREAACGWRHLPRRRSAGRRAELLAIVLIR